jgi:hypothetical protein
MLSFIDTNVPRSPRPIPSKLHTIYFFISVSTVIVKEIALHVLNAIRELPPFHYLRMWGAPFTD